MRSSIKNLVICVFMVALFVTPCLAKIDPAIISGMWLFDEGKGAVAKDDTGSFNGDLNGDAKWADGKFATGIEFAGNGYVQLKKSEQGLPFGGISPFTATAWVKNQGGGTIIGKFNGGVIGAYIITISSGGVVGFHREVAPWSLSGVKSIPANEFGHVAATYDGAKMKIYINGKFDVEQDRAAQNTDTATPVLIGARMTSGKPAEFFRGVLDEVILFNQALNEAQIAEVMKGMSLTKAVDPSKKLASTWGSIKN
ncbi:MAG: LamG domain-containing protein [Candidatus Poribacteria bacterium]